MSDLVVKLTIKGGVDGTFTVATKQASEQLRPIEAGAARAGAASTKAFRASASAAADFGASLDRAKSAVTALAGAWTAASIARNAAAGIIDASKAMNGFSVGLMAATGTAVGARDAMAFVRAESERLGTSLLASGDAFTKLSAATRGTALEGQAARDIFSAVSEASRVMGLSADQTAGALTAIEQMVSKGTVSAEELRGQLGERLPGAFRIAADAMGVTTAELGKMLESGSVAAEDMLPKFANRLRELYDAAAVGADHSPAAEFERMKNAAVELGAAIGESGFMDALAVGAQAAAGAMRLAAEHAAALVAITTTLAVVMGTNAVAAFAKNTISTLAAGSALADMAAMELRSAQAAEIEAAALANKLRVMQPLVGVTAELTVAEASLAAAQARTASATAAATAATAAKTGALAGLGRGLMTLIGGPVGLYAAAIGGIAYAVYDHIESENARAAALEAGIVSLKNATAATRELTAARAENAAANVSEAYAQEAQNIQVLTEKQALLNAATERMGDLAEMNARSIARFGMESRQYLEAVAEVERLTAEMQNLRDATSELTGPVQSRLIAFLGGDLPAVAKDAQAALRDVWQAMRGGDVGGVIASAFESIGKVMEQAKARFIEADKAGNDAFAALEEGSKKAAAALDGFGKSQVQITQAVVDAKIAALEHAKADAKRIEEARKLGTAWVENVRQLEAAKAATKGLGGARDELAKITAENAEQDRIYQAELMKTAEAENDARNAALEAAADRAGQLEAMRLERDMVAMSASAREIANAVREAENLLIRQGVDLSSEAARAHLAEAEAIARSTVEKRESLEATANLRDAWDQFTGSLADAVLDGSDGVKRWWKQMIDDMKRQLIQSGLLKLFGSIFNTGGARAGTSLLGSLFSGGAAAGGSGDGLLGSGSGGLLNSGNWQNIGGSIATGFSQFLYGSGSTSAMGSMLGAANFGPGMATTWAPTTLGAVGLGAAGLGGAYYGYQRSGNLGGAIGYGALGLGGAGALMGVASGAGAIAGGAGAFTAVGSGLGLSGPALAAVPVVGWIIAAIAAVDMITGGKVFGTKYRPDKAVEELRIGMAGGSASQTLTEVRQRSLFRGRQWRDTTTAGSPEAQAAADALFDSVKASMTGAAQALAIDVPPVIDAAIRTVTEYDKKGKVKASQIFVDILGRSFKEADAESAATRIIAEGLIATVDAAAQAFAAQTPSLAKPITETIGKIFDAGMDDYEGGARRGGGIGGGDGIGNGAGGAASTMSEVQRLAERWRGSAQTLMDGAQFLIAAMQAMKADGGLLGLGHSLTETTDLVEELARGEETLTQTFARLMTSTTMLRDAVDLMGASMNTTGADFVKLAQGIVDAAGGLEAAQALWANYFDTFYSLQERTSGALDSILAQRASALDDIGLDSGTTNEQFRAAFEAALPTLTPEQVVEWLQAAASIRAAADAQAAYNAALDAAAQPMRDYEAAVRALAEEAMSASLTDYQREIRAINAARDEEVARLNELARAAGMQAAAEDDLAAIHVIAARKAAEALAKLRQYGRDLVQQFNGGNELDLLNEQIASIESASSSMYQSQVDGLGAVDDAARSTYEAQIAAQQRIREFLDNLMLGPLGGLRPRDQLAEGQRQFDALMERALAGDTDAMAALPQLADQLLRIGQQVYASGDPYFSLRDSIMAALQQVAALPATEPTGGSGGGGSVQVDASSELQALYEERDRLLAEQTAAERLALAQDISAVIRDLIMATREPLETIAADLGVSMSELVSALGVNIEEMTAANANALGDIAASMGVNLAELAANVGVDLGALADRQSLLNDALEAQIEELPADQRDQLAPLLAAVENAADTAGVEAGIEAMEDAINAMAPSLRDQLAPYFEGVDPVDYTQLDALTFIDQNTASTAASLTAHTGLLERIANNLRESNVAAGLPAYATGTAYVPRTGPALIHEGEMILPAPVARIVRNARGGSEGSSAELSAIREELRALREENAKLLQLVAAKLGEVQAEVKEGATKQANATERQTREIGARR